mmetsp:Transcript_104605/g.291244  ORF Transcript_104605/g.291244 Transcript_104605/m.291244 type:complete len:204 (+) Transcript_104605:291-902(+)
MTPSSSFRNSASRSWICWLKAAESSRMPSLCSLRRASKRRYTSATAARGLGTRSLPDNGSNNDGAWAASEVGNALQATASKASKSSCRRSSAATRRPRSDSKLLGAAAPCCWRSTICVRSLCNSKACSSAAVVARAWRLARSSPRPSAAARRERSCSSAERASASNPLTSPVNAEMRPRSCASSAFASSSSLRSSFDVRVRSS